ncbi:MAG: FHA domain-containing protein [Chloroflexi bacterium]|nr:FHA domain-containing protein [Chloroflexota bacterium]
MVAQYQLVMHSGPTPGKTFPMEGDVITIGREIGNGIIINDAEVSRKHTQFVFQGGKFIVTDLGSTNGTFVNGQRLTGQHILQPGEVISLGEQINLLFESVIPIDPNATMLSSRPPVVAPRAVAPRPQPVVQPAPPPVYAGQVPSGPAAVEAGPAQKRGATPIVIGVVVVVLLCACVVGVGLFFAPCSFWLNFMPSGYVCPP